LVGAEQDPLKQAEHSVNARKVDENFRHPICHALHAAFADDRSGVDNVILSGNPLASRQRVAMDQRTWLHRFANEGLN